MNDLMKQYGQSAIVWALLLTMPLWMDAVGGYTELASRVVIMGLAAMSLNFLLGFTGVLSFGHAAYFGLGAYGAGMTIKFLYPSTPRGKNSTTSTKKMPMKDIQFSVWLDT